MPTATSLLKTAGFLSCVALGLWAAGPKAESSPSALGEKPGGDTTVVADGRMAFSFPAANLSDGENGRFFVGNSFFIRNWVQTPASTTARDGLGPHFIARSCGGCHPQDGRGAPPAVARGTPEQPVALLMRLSVPGAAEPTTGVRAEPVYGEQFSNAAIEGVRAEGEVVIRHQAVHGRYADGSRYVLHRPTYSFRKLAYGPMARGVMVSPRLAPQIIGVGLIETIPEHEILRNALDQAQRPGPIRGVPNRVWDAHAQQQMLGRFGWKANVASLMHQTASAFRGDIGITSSLFPTQTCTPTQTDCLSAPHDEAGVAPEIDDTTLGNVVFYQATLAPPARRNARDPDVLRGQALFAQADCSACHRPSYVTGSAPDATLSSQALAGQTIWPYTDLLLHDMGADLADGRPDFAASGRQWKTPPLWGIGLIQGVNGHTRLLHDGRANGVMEAILWHGGEALDSQRKVIAMSAKDRAALVKFVESL